MGDKKYVEYSPEENCRVNDWKVERGLWCLQFAAFQFVLETHSRYRYRTWDGSLGMTAVTNNPYTCQSLQFTAQKHPRIKEQGTKNEGKLGKVFTFLTSQLVKNVIYQCSIHFFLPSTVCFPHEQVPLHISRFGLYPTSSIHCQFDTVSNIRGSQG